MAEVVWRWGGRLQGPRCGESLVPIVPRTLPEVHNLMRILQCSFEVGDASSFRRKLWLVRWTPGCCWGSEGLTHASQPLPAFQREAMLSLIPSSPKSRRLVFNSPLFHSTPPPWEISTAPLALTLTSVMVTPSSVSSALTSFLSNRPV